MFDFHDNSRILSAKIFTCEKQLAFGQKAVTPPLAAFKSSFLNPKEKLLGFYILSLIIKTMVFLVNIPQLFRSYMSINLGSGNGFMP